MRLTIQKVLLLKSVKIFASIENESLAKLASVLEEVEASRGDTLQIEDEISTSLYIIIDGKFRVIRQGKTLAELERGEVFGHTLMLYPQPSPYTVVALDDATVFRLDQDEFYNVLSEDVEIARGVITNLTQRLEELERNSKDRTF